MYGPTGEDEFDWTGCEVVQWDPEKLHGRANVAGTRMFADFILDFADHGMTEDDIAESYGTKPEQIHALLGFAQTKRLKAIA